MRCKQCGAEIAEGKNFCPECGARQDAIPQPPPQGYDAPPQGYEVPPQNYNAPQQSYEAPPQNYNAPPQGYDAPPQGYGGQPYYAAPAKKKSAALPIAIVCSVALVLIVCIIIFLPKLFSAEPAEKREKNGKGTETTAADVQEDGLDLEKINSSVLSQAQSSRVLEQIRGVWKNDDTGYLIGFIEEGGDADHDPAWTLFCGPPNAGTDWSGTVQTPLCGDPEGVVRIPTVQPEYTDMDGEYHPETELNFYVDLRTVSDNSIAWTNEGDEWEHCSFYVIHPDQIDAQATPSEAEGYSAVLSEEETDDLMNSLRAVWMNADRDYFLAFCQIDSDTWEASFGPPFSEYDFSGTVSRTVCRNSAGTIRLTVTGADLNGERHEVYIYLDLSRKADNNIRWCTDEETWKSCDLFCAGVEQIPDHLS